MAAENRLKLKVNGSFFEVVTSPMKRLLDVLRENLKLTGTKEGCGEGECGACAVLINGELVNSCLVPAIQADGAEIVTIEGIANAPSGKALQSAFVACGGVQCGMCTPGMIVASSSLLQKSSGRPSELEIRNSLSGNLCRCTGYGKIIDSVEKAFEGSTK